GINKNNGRVSGVITEKGAIEAEIVVNSAGLWGREVGKMAGVNVPLHAAEHYYLLTEPIEGVHPELPIIEDFGRYSYFREEVGGLLVGFFEPVAAPWGMDGIPKDFSFGEIKPDWDRMMPYIELATERIPILQNVGIHKFFCGPESFTPDGGPLLGESPELENFYVAAGLNSLGILQGGGVGKIMAQWIVRFLLEVFVHVNLHNNLNNRWVKCVQPAFAGCGSLESLSSPLSSTLGGSQVSLSFILTGRR
ncbi:unnamed protein product, partial [marine sediment metagenome]